MVYRVQNGQDTACGFCCSGFNDCCLVTWTSACFNLNATGLDTVPAGGLNLNVASGANTGIVLLPDAHDPTLATPLGVGFNVQYISYQSATDATTGQTLCRQVTTDVYLACGIDGKLHAQVVITRPNNPANALVILDPDTGEPTDCRVLLGQGFAAADMDLSITDFEMDMPVDCSQPVTFGEAAGSSSSIADPATGSTFAYGAVGVTFGFDLNRSGTESCSFSADDDAAAQTCTAAPAPETAFYGFVGNSGHLGADCAPAYVVYDCCGAAPPPVVIPCPSPPCGSGDDGGIGGGDVTGIECCARGEVVSRSLHAAIVPTGGSACFASTAGMTWSNGFKVWAGNDILCGAFVNYVVYCDGGVWTFKLWINGVLAVSIAGDYATATGTCSPLDLLWTFDLTGSPAAAGIATGVFEFHVWEDPDA